MRHLSMGEVSVLGQLDWKVMWWVFGLRIGSLLEYTPVLF